MKLGLMVEKAACVNTLKQNSGTSEKMKGVGPVVKGGGATSRSRILWVPGPGRGHISCSAGCREMSREGTAEAPVREHCGLDRAVQAEMVRSGQDWDS